MRDADCRVAWRDGERLSLIAEPRDRVPSVDGGTRRLDVLEPAACRGAILVQGPRADTSDAVLVLVGTWRRDPAAQDGWLPPRAERAGKLVAMVARPIAVRASLRSRLRTGAERRLMTLFGARRWPLAAALTVSPEAALPQDIRQRFARAGLAHILSISGLHVAILAGALIILLRALRLPPGAARVAAIVLVAGYIWLLGFPAPALRSAGFLALWVWGAGQAAAAGPGGDPRDHAAPGFRGRSLDPSSSPGPGFRSPASGAARAAHAGGSASSPRHAAAVPASRCAHWLR